ncbi:MAG TPA: hypothetical protein VFA11_10055 [Acidimicrobiales bacterium]|nr:hypothetical protein [Acidimicrobiales bacterium]
MSDDLEAWLDRTEGARRTLDALGELGGEAAPAEVGERSGVAKSSRTKWLAELRRRGLVEGPKGRVRLTRQGRSLANRSEPVVDLGAALEGALDAWPTVWHRAALRLALSAVVGRHHLAGVEAFAGHFPGLVVVGPTGSGKSEMARFVMATFGLDRVAHTVWLPQQSKGSVFGRREPVEGGGRAFVAVPWLGRPFVLFEEADKAPPEVRARVLAYFQGNVEALEEGERLQLRPTPYLAANTAEAGQAAALVPGEYCRRSVVLDLWHVASMVDDLGERLEGLYAGGGPPRLRLEDLRPPAERLDENARGILASREAGIRKVMTDHGWAQCDRVGLEVLALGRAGLLGLRPGEDLRGVAVETGMDYLTVAETMPGEIVEGWSLEMSWWREWARSNNGAGIEELARHLEQLYAQREQVARAVVDRRRSREVEEVGLVEARGAFSERLRLAEFAIRQVPPELKPEAAGLRDALRKLRDRVDNAKRREGLAEVQALAADPLTRAEAMRADLDEVRRQLEEQKRVERDRVQQAKARAAEERRRVVEMNRQAREHEKAVKEGWRQELTRTRDLARSLEKLFRKKRTPEGENAFEVLADMQLFGYRLLTYEPDPPPPPIPPDANWWTRRTWPQPTGRGTWHTLEPRKKFAGTSQSCPALAKWGTETQWVLAPVLAALYVHEDRLTRALGVKARANRVALRSDIARPQLVQNVGVATLALGTGSHSLR